MRRTRRFVIASFVLLASGSAVLACGDDDDSNAAVCDDVDALRTSVETVQDADLGEDVLTALNEELPKIEAGLQQLDTDAETEYSAEVDAVQAQFDTLRSTVEAAVSSPSAGTLADVQASVDGVGAAIGNLHDAVTDTC